VTNEKRLVDRAGLRPVDGIVASLSEGASADALRQAIDQVQALCEKAAT
jgi:hypothetical protein